MPSAQWVLDAAYTGDVSQATGTSPSRQRLGIGTGLQLDLRGVSTNSTAKGSQSPSALKWKPANGFKSLGGAENASPSSAQPYPALLLSLLSSTNCTTNQQAAPNSLPQHTGNQPAGASSTAASRGAAGTITSDGGGLTRRARPTAPPQPTSSNPSPSRSQPNSFFSTRVASSTSAAAALTTAMTRPSVTYGPLILRQDSGRRPSLDEPPVPGGPPASSSPQGPAAVYGLPPSGPSAPGAAAPSGARGGRRSTALSGTPSPVPASSPSPSGTGAHASGGQGLAPLDRVWRVAAPSSHQQHQQQQQQQQQHKGLPPCASTMSVYGSTSAADVGLVMRGAPSPTLSADPWLISSPQQQQQSAQEGGATFGNSGGSGGGGGASPKLRGAARDAAGGAGGPGGGNGNGNVPGAKGDVYLRPQPQWPPQPPGQLLRPSPTGMAASPALTLGGGSSGTEDSAFEYLGEFEGDVASGEDAGEGEEEDGEEFGEEGEEEAGEEAPTRHRSGSAQRVRSMAAVHEARRAAAPSSSPSPHAGTSGKVFAASPYSRSPLQSLSTAQRPPSRQSGRPPPHPAGPRTSAMAAAAGAPGSVSGLLRTHSRGNSSGEGESRPTTASSTWSAGCELLLASEIQSGPPYGRGPGSGNRLSDSTPASSGRSGATRGAGQSTGAGGACGVDTGGGGVGRGNSYGSVAACRRAVSNPRDVATLAARRGGGASSGGGGGGPSRSRCSSAASTRRGGGGGGGGAEKNAVQALALLASLALAAPSSPSAASLASFTSSTGSARRRGFAASASAGGGGPAARGRKTVGGAIQPRPIHPAVLAVTDAAAAAMALTLPKDGTPQRSHNIPTDNKGRPFPYIQPPAVPGTCPTIAFVGSATEKAAAGLTPLMSPTLLVKYGGVANTPVRTAFREAGLRPTRKGKRWVVQWGGILDAGALAKLHAFQRVNHFPGTWELGHKGHLYRNVYNARRRARGPAAEAFDIVPRFYLLPRDYEEFRNDSERFPDRMYIQKPTNSSRGRGVRMVTRPEAISRDAKDLLVQHYVANPLLLNGFKFDMRVYAAATCLDPLRLYIFHDGLARLATEPYSADKSDLSKRCVHLTNYSVNKKSSKFVRQPDQVQQQQQQQQPSTSTDSPSKDSHRTSRDGSPAVNNNTAGTPSKPSAAGAGAVSSSSSSSSHIPSGPVDPLRECEGSKWSLSGLRAYLESRGLGPGWEAVWRQVCDIVAAAVIAAEPRMNTEFKMKVPHRNNCFEVWGFDIMLTDTFRAWLIEANTCPSLAADSALDMRIKGTMVAQLMHLIGPVPYDVDVYEKAAEARRQARLTGLPHPPPTGASGAAAGGARSGGGGGEGDGIPPTPGSGGMTPVAGGAGGVVAPRSLHELEGVDFTALSPGELPDTVLEAEAEMVRRGNWQRVFPCEEDPLRYLNLFETPRLNNLLLCKYYAQMAGIHSGGGGRTGGGGVGSSGIDWSDVFRRPGSSTRAVRVAPGVSTGGGRPLSREWCPG